MKSVSPRHVEALLVDALRLRHADEVRQVLRGYPGLPSIAGELPPAPPLSPPPQQERAGNRDGNAARDDGGSSGTGEDRDKDKGRPEGGKRASSGSSSSSDMPELLAALSRAIEEEIRGSKGLFGLETGVLERLKGGARVTPFLRHGSVRRQESVGATPHGLAAGGMKKWWRCPRCHISQVCKFVFLWYPARRSKQPSKTKTSLWSRKKAKRLKVVYGVPMNGRQEKDNLPHS